MIRKMRSADVPKLKALHEKAGYGFEFPSVEQIEVARVIEEGGRIVGWVGAKLEAEIVGIFDLDWGTPGERMKAFAHLHAPIAVELNRLKVQTANVHLDPKFPAFGRRLSQLGWSKALWSNYFMDVKKAVKALVQ